MSTSLARTQPEPAAIEVPDEIEPVVCGNCLNFQADPGGNTCRAHALASRGLRDLSARTTSHCQEFEARS
jgi:hypothetical protein